MAFTTEGKRSFGQWVLDARTSRRTRDRVSEWLKISNPYEELKEFVAQDQFARFISAQSGIPIGGANIISRLERGAFRTSPLTEDMAALLRAEVLLIGDRPATFDDVVEVLEGKVTPKELRDRTLATESEVSQYGGKLLSEEKAMCDRAYHLFREAIAARYDVKGDRGYRQFCREFLLNPDDAPAQKLRRIVLGECPPSRTDWAIMAGILKGLDNAPTLTDLFNCLECQEA